MLLSGVFAGFGMPHARYLTMMFSPMEVIATSVVPRKCGPPLSPKQVPAGVEDVDVGQPGGVEAGDGPGFAQKVEQVRFKGRARREVDVPPF